MRARVDSPAGLRFWRPVPREVADIICGEGAVDGLPIHAHDALHIILPGSPFAIVDGTGTTTVVRPEQVHIAAPLELHGAHSIDGASCVMRVVLVPLSALPLSAHSWENAVRGRRQFVVDDAALYAELWSLIGEVRRPLVDLASTTRLLRIIGSLLAPLTPVSSQVSSRRVARHIDGLDRVGAHLRAHLAESVSLDELAGIAGLSKFYLLRAFRRAYGVTPHGYQRQLRLAHAWRAIADGKPLTRATYDAGFADQSHLTRQFASMYGVTPARCARQLTMPSDTVGTTRNADRSAPSSAA